MQESGLVSSNSLSYLPCTLTIDPKYTTDLDPTSRLKSITQEKDLDEFFSTAQLAGTEFTAGASVPHT